MLVLKLTKVMVALIRKNVTVPQKLLDAVDTEILVQETGAPPTEAQQSVIAEGEAAAKSAMQQVEPTMAGPNAAAQVLPQA